MTAVPKSRSTVKNAQLSHPKAALALFGRETSTALLSSTAPSRVQLPGFPFPCTPGTSSKQQQTSNAAMHCSYPESSPSMRGSICSNTNAQHLPGSFSATPNKWICQLWALHQKREKGKKTKKKKKSQTPQLIPKSQRPSPPLKPALFCLACMSGDTSLD